MLEGKQIELSKHLKELSLKNDQVSYFYWLYSSLASQSQINYSLQVNFTGDKWNS